MRGPAEGYGAEPCPTPRTGIMSRLDTTTDLYRMRHSAAHVMAAAVCRLYDNVQLDIGPPTENGFYYDFDLPHRLTPEDFEAIEKAMAEFIAEDHPFECLEVSREEATGLIREMGQRYKVERLADTLCCSGSTPPPRSTPSNSRST